VASASIGLNRSEHGQAAGLRTLILVSLAACLAMLQVNLLQLGRLASPLLGFLRLAITGLLAREAFGQEAILPAVFMADLSPHFLVQAVGSKTHGMLLTRIITDDFDIPSGYGRRRRDR